MTYNSIDVDVIMIAVGETTMSKEFGRVIIEAGA